MSVPKMSQALQNVTIGGGVEAALFPAKSKHVAGLVDGSETDVSSVYFSDKILITISQEGLLSQWVRGSLLYLVITVLAKSFFRFKYLSPRHLQPQSTLRCQQKVAMCFHLGI